MQHNQLTNNKMLGNLKSRWQNENRMHKPFFDWTTHFEVHSNFQSRRVRHRHRAHQHQTTKLDGKKTMDNVDDMTTSEFSRIFNIAVCTVSLLSTAFGYSATQPFSLFMCCVYVLRRNCKVSFKAFASWRFPIWPNSIRLDDRKKGRQRVVEREWWEGEGRKERRRGEKRHIEWESTKNRRRWLKNEFKQRMHSIFI